MKIQRTLAIVVAFSAVTWSLGCVGAREIAKVKPSTAETRTEIELVPDATLARQDTSPDPKGRIGFVKGSDQLLVVTHITSVLEGQDTPNPTRTDRYIERLWITIPLDAPSGAALAIEELQEIFLVGYDRNEAGKGFFKRPFRARGKLTLLENRGDTAVIRLHVRVHPEAFPSWQIDEQIPVPVTSKGIYATAITAVSEYHPDKSMYPFSSLGIASDEQFSPELREPIEQEPNDDAPFNIEAPEIDLGELDTPDPEPLDDGAGDDESLDDTPVDGDAVE